MRATDPLLVGLVDDAALFPPGNAAMADALSERAAYRTASWSAAVGPFLCPASRTDELLAAVAAVADAPTGPLDLALVLDVGGDAAHRALQAVAGTPSLRLLAVEVAHEHLGDDAPTVGTNLDRALSVTGVLEVPRTGFDASLELIGTPGWQVAKYRTGGVTADAFPSEGELADFLLACAARRAPFKLTAGLHHALRHTTAEGLEAHGLLNVLVATERGLAQAPRQDVVDILAERAAEPLVAAVQSWDTATGTDVRRAFRSFGCCGVRDPLTDLADLGLMEDCR